MTKQQQQKRQKAALTKRFAYIGEFMWNCGSIESNINEIFLQLFDLERLRFIFIGLVDVRKKIDLIRAGLTDQGKHEDQKLLGNVHELLNLRNAFAHASFSYAEGGIDVDHVSHKGTFGWDEKKRKGDDGFDTYVSFKDFEGYFEQQTSILEKLSRLSIEVTPISSPSRELIASINEIIDSSPNVIRYSPASPPK